MSYKKGCRTEFRMCLLKYYANPANKTKTACKSIEIQAVEKIKCTQDGSIRFVYSFINFSSK